MSAAWGSPVPSAKLTGLPCGVLAGVCAYLPAPDVAALRAASRLLRCVLDSNPAAWQATIFQPGVGGASSSSSGGATAPGALSRRSSAHYRAIRLLSAPINASAAVAIMADSLTRLATSGLQFHRALELQRAALAAPSLAPQAALVLRAASQLPAPAALAGGSGLAATLTWAWAALALAAQLQSQQPAAASAAVGAQQLAASAAALAVELLRSLAAVHAVSACNAYACTAAWVSAADGGAPAAARLHRRHLRSAYLRRVVPVAVVGSSGSPRHSRAPTCTPPSYYSSASSSSSSTSSATPPGPPPLPFVLAPYEAASASSAGIVGALDWLAVWLTEQRVPTLLQLLAAAPEATTALASPSSPSSPPSPLGACAQALLLATQAASALVLPATAAATPPPPHAPSGYLTMLASSPPPASSSLPLAQPSPPLCSRAALLELFVASVTYRYEKSLATAAALRATCAASEAAASRRRAALTAAGAQHPPNTKLDTSRPPLGRMRIGLTLDVHAVVNALAGAVRLTPSGVTALVPQRQPPAPPAALPPRAEQGGARHVFTFSGGSAGLDTDSGEFELGGSSALGSPSSSPRTASSPRSVSSPTSCSPSGHSSEHCTAAPPTRGLRCRVESRVTEDGGGAAPGDVTASINGAARDASSSSYSSGFVSAQSAGSPGHFVELESVPVFSRPCPAGGASASSSEEGAHGDGGPLRTPGSIVGDAHTSSAAPAGACRALRPAALQSVASPLQQTLLAVSYGSTSSSSSAVTAAALSATSASSLPSTGRSGRVTRREVGDDGADAAPAIAGLDDDSTVMLALSATMISPLAMASSSLPLPHTVSGRAFEGFTDATPSMSPATALQGGGPRAGGGVFGAASHLLSQLRLGGTSSARGSLRVASATAGVDSPRAPPSPTAAAPPPAPASRSPLARLTRWLAESLSEPGAGGGDFEDRAMAAEAAGGFSSRRGLWQRTAAHGPDAQSDRGRRVGCDGVTAHVSRPSVTSALVLAPLYAAPAAPLPPPAHLAAFARERVTFLSVCDGWVVAQTASGLAIAFPVSLAPGTPLAEALQQRQQQIHAHERSSCAAIRDADVSALAAPLRWPLIHLNLRPGHVVHCTYINPRSRPGPTLITCVSDETFHLRCFATPLAALCGGQAVVEAVTVPVFTEDAFRHPGFVEANSVNNTALTYGCVAGSSNAAGMHYRVWELDGYTPAVTVPDTGVVDVKFSLGSLVVTLTGPQACEATCALTAVRVPVPTYGSRAPAPAASSSPHARHSLHTPAAADATAPHGSAVASTPLEATPTEPAVALNDDQRRLVTCVNHQLARVDAAVLSSAPPPHAQPADAPAAVDDGASPHPPLPPRLAQPEPVHPSSDLAAELLHSAAAGSLIAVRLYSLRTGRVAASIGVGIIPGCTIQLLEVFNGLLLLKQMGHPLRVIDVATGCHLSQAASRSDAAVGDAGGHPHHPHLGVPYAQVFHYLSGQFLAVHEGCLELRGCDGRLLARSVGAPARAVYAALLGQNQTGTSMCMTHAEGTMLMLGQPAPSAARAAEAEPMMAPVAATMTAGPAGSEQAADGEPQQQQPLACSLARGVDGEGGSAGSASAGVPPSGSCVMLFSLGGGHDHGALQRAPRGSDGDGGGERAGSASGLTVVGVLRVAEQAGHEVAVPLEALLAAATAPTPGRPLQAAPLRPAPSAAAGASPGGGSHHPALPRVPAPLPAPAAAAGCAPPPSSPPAPTTAVKYDEATGHVLTADGDGLVHVWVSS